MIQFDEDTLTGIVRAEVSFARDNGNAVEPELLLALAVADLLELPDDTKFVQAVEVAMKTPTCLDDLESVTHTAKVARAAGYNR